MVFCCLQIPIKAEENARKKIILTKILFFIKQNTLKQKDVNCLNFVLVDSSYVIYIDISMSIQPIAEDIFYVWLFLA